MTQCRILKGIHALFKTSRLVNRAKCFGIEVSLDLMKSKKLVLYNGMVHAVIRHASVSMSQNTKPQRKCVH